jgi:uncharacterized protein
MYPKEYIQFLVHFHGDQDFFECHEILEEYWKKVDNQKKESLWVAFILMAVSAYHHRRENFKGAEKTLKKSIVLFQKLKEDIGKIGLDGTRLIILLQEQEKFIEQKQIFHSYPLPISDTSLENHCIELAHSMGMSWKNSEIIPPNIIHRHLTRDRSSVIKEREKAIQMRHKP